jgi:hypothetical protein
MKFLKRFHGRFWGVNRWIGISWVNYEYHHGKTNTKTWSGFHLNLGIFTLMYEIPSGVLCGL